MPHFKSFASIIIISLATSLFAASCVQKDPLFGNIMVPPGQEMFTGIDSNLKVKTYNINVDSIVSKNISEIMLIGSHVSPISGLTEASILTNYMPKGFKDDKYFGKNAKIDSMKMLVNVKFEKGDTTKHSTLEIYDFSGFVLRYSKKYFSNFDVTPYISEKTTSVARNPRCRRGIIRLFPIGICPKIPRQRSTSRKCLQQRYRFPREIQRPMHENKTG